MYLFSAKINTMFKPHVASGYYTGQHSLAKTAALPPCFLWELREAPVHSLPSPGTLGEEGPLSFLVEA